MRFLSAHRPYLAPALAGLSLPQVAAACSPCRTMVAAAVFDNSLPLMLGMLLLPLMLVAALAAWVHHGR